MVVTIRQLIEYYKDFADPKGKIAREVKNGKLFPIIKGLYETESSTPPQNLAQFIYGPSYISFDRALSNYGLLSEAVYTITCATYGKNKSKIYKNRFGTFAYRDIPKEVFSYGVRLVAKEYYSYQIATPEKALCDKLYIIPPVNTLKAFKQLLFEDLRINEERFFELDKDFIFKIAPLYKKKNLSWLVAYLKEN